MLKLPKPFRKQGQQLCSDGNTTVFFDAYNVDQMHDAYQQGLAAQPEPCENAERCNEEGSCTEGCVFRKQAQPERAPLSDKFLQPNDYHLLHRFIETTEDDEGYDIKKAEIKRLADLGVVQSHGFGKYSVTMFGYWVHERYWEQNPSLPLKTNSDRNAEAAIKQGGQHD